MHTEGLSIASPCEAGKREPETKRSHAPKIGRISKEISYATNDKSGYLQTFQRVLNDAPAPLASEEFEEARLEKLNLVLLRALNKVPRQRYGSASEFGDALKHALCHHQPEAELHVAPERQRSRTMPWLGRLCGVLIAALTISWLLPDGRPVDPLQFSDKKTADSGETEGAAAILDITFLKLRAPHLPEGWTGAPPVCIDNGQLTIPPGTRKPATVCSNEMDVPGDWLLTIEHELHGNGEILLTLVGNDGQTVDFSLFQGRIELTNGKREKTATVGRRRLSIRKEQDRFIALLQGAQPIHIDARRFSQLSQLQFALQNAGSGGGSAGIHRVILQQKEIGG